MDPDVDARKPSRPVKEGPSAEHDETAAAIQGTVDYVLDPVSYGPGGLRGIYQSPYVFGTALLASLGGFSMGYDMGVISVINTMDQFHAVFPRAESGFGEGLMTGMLLLGSFVGCLFMPYMADTISRKWALTVVVVIFDIGAILQTAAVSYAMLVVGRFIGGIGVGTLAMGAPLYISEIAPANIRGTLLVLESVAITLGVVVAFWISFATKFMAGEASFRLPFGLQMVTATALGAGIHFFPYSPRWLALVNRLDECRSSLSKLRGLPGTDERIEEEHRGIVSEIQFQKLVMQKRHPGATGIELEIHSWLDLFGSRMWKRTAVGCGVGFFQQFSGINAFIYYAPTLFSSLGQSSEKSLILSGVFDILQLIASLVCSVAVDHAGRRFLAIAGGFGCSIAYIIIAVLSGLYSDDWSANTSAGWACVVMAFVFILIYGVSYSPLGWALPAEVYPNTSRSKGVALATCVIWISDFIVGVVTPTMMNTIGYGTYVFFGAMCFLAGVWAFFLVPETSGKTLEEIDELFGDSSGQEETQIIREAMLASAGNQDITKTV